MPPARRNASKRNIQIMQNPYAAERKKQHDGTRNKGAFKRGTDFLAFIQMRCDSKKNGRGANWVDSQQNRR